MKIVISDNLRTIILTLLLSYALTVLNAQTLHYDYHPYEYATEELFLTSLGIRETYESTDCGEVQAIMNNFYNANARGDEEEKSNLMRHLSFLRCPESFQFLERQIKTSPSETTRCNAIMFLAWMTNPEYLPCLLEYSKKSALSTQEKAAIATAFVSFGVHTGYANLNDQSLVLLDEICWEEPVTVLASCILNYMNLGGASAINFFNAQLEQEEYRLYAAFFLAQLGEHKQTFPIFAEALSSNDEYEVYTAVIGLAEIDTEEAMELIMNLPPEKNRLTLRERLINFNPKVIKKGDKL
jgi:hypothetical protein